MYALLYVCARVSVQKLERAISAARVEAETLRGLLREAAAANTAFATPGPAAADSYGHGEGEGKSSSTVTEEGDGEVVDEMKEDLQAACRQIGELSSAIEVLAFDWSCSTYVCTRAGWGESAFGWSGVCRRGAGGRARAEQVCNRGIGHGGASRVYVLVNMLVCHNLTNLQHCRAYRLRTNRKNRLLVLCAPRQT